MALIALEHPDGFPIPVPEAGELCVQCGHCVAVCPAGALSLESMKSSDCPPVRPDLFLNAEQAEHFLRSRRSIRKYRNRPVPRETIVRLIETARYAPSGHNLQPVEWRVVETADEVRRLAGVVAEWLRSLIVDQPELAAALHVDRLLSSWDRGEDRICRDAPHVVVAHAHKNDRTAPPACVIALTYLELAAPSLGLGACWAGFFNAAAAAYPPMAEALDLPAGHRSFGAMMLGYPQFSYHRLPLRKAPVITWR